MDFQYDTQVKPMPKTTTLKNAPLNCSHPQGQEKYMKKYLVKAVIRVWTATVIVIAWIGVCPASYPYFTTLFSAGSAVQLKDDHGANGWGSS